MIDVEMIHSSQRKMLQLPTSRCLVVSRFLCKTRADMGPAREGKKDDAVSYQLCPTTLSKERESWRKLRVSRLIWAALWARLGFFLPRLTTGWWCEEKEDTMLNRRTESEFLFQSQRRLLAVMFPSRVIVTFTRQF